MRIKTKITTLIDNVVYGKNLFAEHGFSLFIETENKKILFDSGQSGNFIHNARVLGINISEIDVVIISHGHYDHTGGLSEFVKYNDKAKILIKEEAFLEKYKNKTNFIGIPFNRAIIEKRVELVKETIEVLDNIFIIPKIEIHNSVDTHFKGMFIKKQNDFLDDLFDDEQFVVIKTKDNINIISGCSHRGITNILKTAIDLFELPINYALGGYHLIDENNEKTNKIIEILKGFNIKNIGVSHCTGIEKYYLLKNIITSSTVFYNSIGNSTIIDYISSN